MADQQTEQQGDRVGPGTEADAPHHPSLIERVQLLVLRIQQLRPVRVVQQFGTRQGNLLAAGMSYQALFAIFAALWLTFSVAGIWLTSNPILLHSLIDLLNRSIPGLIGQDGVVSEQALTRVSGTLGWTGIIAAVGLLLTATGWLASTRIAVRAMFGLGNDPTNPVLQKLRDLGLAFAFGLLLIIAALVSLVSTAVIGQLLELIGFSHSSFWVPLAGSSIGFLVTAALNTITLAGMFRLLSHLAIPLPRLLVGALLGGIALAVLSTLSGLVLGGASRNPLAASFAVIIGLLIWFNLVCRVLLIAATWIAVGMKDAGLSAERASAEERAAQFAIEQHGARETLARGAVVRAQRNLENARGFRRWVARRRLEGALLRLSEVRVEGARLAERTGRALS